MPRYRVNPKGPTLCEGGQHPPGSYIELEEERAESLADDLVLGMDGKPQVFPSGNSEISSDARTEGTAPPESEDGVDKEAEVGSQLETAALEGPPESRMIGADKATRKKK